MPAAELRRAFAVEIHPGRFRPEAHFYPRAREATIHRTVAAFLEADPAALRRRYLERHPEVAPHELDAVWRYAPRHLRWAGGDLFAARTAEGRREMVLIETNSCPSGMKSMPALDRAHPDAGYRRVVEHLLLPPGANTDGEFAILYDKNFAEVSGYAHALADVLGRPVHLVPVPDEETDHVWFDGGRLLFRTESRGVLHATAALRYVTQRPWNRFPVRTETTIVNPIVACLAGGRNKLAAAKAYDLYNEAARGSGLRIRTPETVCDVPKREVPDLVEHFGGSAVVKVPYANAGQGVFTITSPFELEHFMAADTRYAKFVVQALLGGTTWPPNSRNATYRHTGMRPDANGHRFVADLRMGVVATDAGFIPSAIYARKAARPLDVMPSDGSPSWDILGTNLSIAQADGGWAAETERLVLASETEFDDLDLDGDDLLDAFVQTILAVIAIDRMAGGMLLPDGELDREALKRANDDDVFLDELATGALRGGGQGRAGR
ncbi:MAG: hypothetical protein KC417_00705 [Myxococcales bacterium]|nr:hypothetical protein [Myxococcales bacterium]